jgi:hypothetical protein
MFDDAEVQPTTCVPRYKSKIMFETYHHRCPFGGHFCAPFHLGCSCNPWQTQNRLIRQLQSHNKYPQTFTTRSKIFLQARATIIHQGPRHAIKKEVEGRLFVTRLALKRWGEEISWEETRRNISYLRVLCTPYYPA